mmetsp:Transcript_15612/g.28354  ORF Transcript_15612/g.28354 Transcript_15612/m.28354 type:complete len:95 (-) Transcript_15612:66-350(-)
MGNARKITPTANNDAVRTKEHINVTMHVEFSYFFAWIGRDAAGGDILLLDVYNDVRVAQNFRPSYWLWKSYFREGETIGGGLETGEEGGRGAKV